MPSSAPREPGAKTVFVFRWGIPLAVILAAIIVFVVSPSLTSAEGSAGMIGAGLAWILFGVLFRQGQQGDEERDVEDAARDYLDEHGRWPSDAEYETYKRSGRWRAPAGVQPS